MTRSSDIPAVSATHVAWLLFAPPFAVTALRFVLGTLAERWPPVQPLVRAVAAGDGRAPLDGATAELVWLASMPVLITLGIAVAGVLAARLALRTWGWQRVRPWAARLWLLAWALAAAVLLAQYLNRAALQPRPDAAATVLQARPHPSSARGPGGAMALLALAGEAAPRRVLLEGADFRALPPGRTVMLRRADGRFWGEYVTGADAPLAPPIDASGVPPASR